jgi:tRNA 2-selenouridine synthase
MAIQKITIEQFLELAQTYPVLDVRSPGEFMHAHIPGAHSFPLFTDEERKVVGTAYKQQSREDAIKIGLDYFGLKMRKMVEEAEQVVKEKTVPLTIVREDIKAAETTKLKQTVLVHCWRGGMRSAGVAWLLDLYGFKVYTLTGGYKVYRNWARAQFAKDYFFNVLGGYTGSGKTLVLQELKKLGKNVIDLERLANHKGSAFGGLGEPIQPSQEMFENLLAMELSKVNKPLAAAPLIPEEESPAPTKLVYIEDESQRIGQLNIPAPVWEQMRRRPISFFDVPFENRLDYLTDEYGKFDKEKLVNAIIRIQKRLGGLETKNAINHLLENNHRECFRILLMYYDKWYDKGLHNRERLSELLNKIPCSTVNIKAMTYTLVNENATA